MSERDPLVLAALARVFVEDIDGALPLYERLAGGAEARRFAFGDVRLAWIGPFLLLQADGEARARFGDRVASLLVSDMDRVLETLDATGATVLEGPAPGPNGARLIARHADGAVFEYLETR